jgi:hypothetical protein
MRKQRIAIEEGAPGDHLAGIEAHVNIANDWLAARPELVAGTNGLPGAVKRQAPAARSARRLGGASLGGLKTQKTLKKLR